MKERIVIKDEFWVKHFQEREKDFNEEQLYSGGNPEDWWHYKLEQVPETFEELKELCKNLESKNVFVKNVWNCIEFNGLSFWQDGRISHDADQSMYAIKLDVTPARQWQIIKSLIGEE